MSKKQDVMEKLDKVYDPELDQPLTDLDFIDDITIEGSDVEVKFRLPTYWCSPNFAYIMAEDIKEYVSEIDWVKEVRVILDDHCASDEINHGVAQGKQFSQSFEGQTTGDLNELRKTFRIKAFYSRQDRLVRHLLNDGFSKEELVRLTLQELEGITLSEEGIHLRDKYLQKKKELNHPNTCINAITDPEGNAITIDDLSDYLLGIKTTRLSMEFNGHYCRGLLEARYHLEKTN
ncbi:iron-sulfur cluster assembly protein [Virgibacillus sp. MSP4-1]|uniref:iron-sulfur cluster assembly protein n=1 Tax=Virgibacillus sp. MSP4-1 TaxID=2700081 RepID=UPI00039F4F49|nr:iron-sulfur cluster assembly protein [Virgibacillus sp. MSP4-1]QHS21808.1 iron-sulfur cluster assembly protein [Virgibacillus sp. MSP4-1]